MVSFISRVLSKLISNVHVWCFTPTQMNNIIQIPALIASQALNAIISPLDLAALTDTAKCVKCVRSSFGPTPRHPESHNCVIVKDGEELIQDILNTITVIEHVMSSCPNSNYDCTGAGHVLYK